MRISPLALACRGMREDEVARLAREDSALTHPHPVCGDAAAAFVIAIVHALSGGGPPESSQRAALQWAERARARPEVVECLRAAEREAPECDGAHQGFVLIALQNAFYELLHAEGVEQGVARTVARGGDTDTNAAIAGALLGAQHGRDA